MSLQKDSPLRAGSDNRNHHNQHNHNHNHNHDHRRPNKQHQLHQHESLPKQIPGLSFVLALLMTSLAAGSVQGAKQEPLDHQPNTIKIACILPADSNYLFSLPRVRPAIEIAVEKVTHPTEGRLAGRKVEVLYADSTCGSAYSMHMAIEFYIKNRPHVYFGPVCDYATAPVTRQVSYWQIPQISQCVARDFARKKEEYPMLTRLGATINGIIRMFQVVMNRFYWSNLKVYYMPTGRDDIMTRFCHVAADGIQMELSVLMNTTIDYYKFETLEEGLGNLKEEIGLKHSGK